jgi:hypothetical protein
VLHFIFIVEGEKGLGVRVSCIPELEGQATPARQLFLRSHERQLREVGPPARRLRCVTVWARRGLGSIRGVDHLSVRLLLPLVRWGVIEREVDHCRCRPLGQESPPLAGATA